MFACNQFWPQISSFLKIYFICNYLCWGFLQLSTCAHKSQKRVLHALELELWIVVSYPVWVLGTTLGPLQKQYVFLSDELCLQPHG